MIRGYDGNEEGEDEDDHGDAGGALWWLFSLCRENGGQDVGSCLGTERDIEAQRDSAAGRKGWRE